MLDLRGLYVSDRGSRGEGNSTLHLSEVRFAGLSSTLLGNLGATLQYPSTGDIHSTSEEDLGDEAPHFCNDPFRTGLLDCARDHDGAVDAV
ncbi:hypothetical protein C8Q77DRAFT_1140885 [Trametes polyzona]|nr:hypothetical protein C8Q77DRAFT_1140885 [Trametes polyzona]